MKIRCGLETVDLNMEWYYYIAWAAILAQLLVVYHVARNYRYALSKCGRTRQPTPGLRVALIVPCKGLDGPFQANIASFLKQDYGDYRLFFVVAEETDDAYARLCEMKEAAGRDSKASDIQVLVAGPSASCSQKIHNLLYAVGRIPDDTEVLAFADSDVCAHEGWLSHLVWPLRQPGRGLTTGYRWFIPTQNNLASLAMSAINAGIAQLLGNSPLNLAWGGSMAIRVDDFHQLNVEQLWRNTLSDDLSLSHAVKKARMKIIFVPECIVPSFDQVTWSRLYEFARRQFLIARVYVPAAWWGGFFANLGSIVGFWGGLALAAYAAATHAEHTPLYAAVPAVFFAGQVARAVLRQLLAVQILSKYSPQLWWAAAADVLGCWFWSVLLFVFILSSAVGRTIRWRGIRYRLNGPTQTVVIGG
ncbi:MAG: glycosyltransferase [Sedimentisphaerales bacterium]|nr:glycosyltransferase [Sedimentisphaerales bacterium]